MDPLDLKKLIGTPDPALLAEELERLRDRNKELEKFSDIAMAQKHLENYLNPEKLTELMQKVENLMQECQEKQTQIQKEYEQKIFQMLESDPSTRHMKVIIQTMAKKMDKGSDQ